MCLCGVVVCSLGIYVDFEEKIRFFSDRWYHSSLFEISDKWLCLFIGYVTCCLTSVIGKNFLYSKLPRIRSISVDLSIFNLIIYYNDRLFNKSFIINI